MKNEKFFKKLIFATIVSISTIGQTNAQGVDTLISFGGFVLNSMSSQSDPTASIALQNYNLLTDLSSRLDGVENGIVELYKEIGMSEERIKSFVTSSFNTNDVKTLISVSQAYLNEVKQLENERSDLVQRGKNLKEINGRIEEISRETAFRISELRQKVSLGTYLSAPTVAATASVEVFARLKAGQGESLALVFDDIDQYFVRALNEDLSNSISSEVSDIRSKRKVWMTKVQSQLGAKSLVSGFYPKSCSLFALSQIWSLAKPINNQSQSLSVLSFGVDLVIDKVEVSDSTIEYARIPSVPNVKITTVTHDTHKGKCVDGKNPNLYEKAPIHKLSGIGDYNSLRASVDEFNIASDALFTLLTLRQQVSDLQERFQEMATSHLGDYLYADQDTRNLIFSNRSSFSTYIRTITVMQSMEAAESRDGLRNLMVGYREAQEESRRVISRADDAIANAIAKSAENENAIIAKKLLSYISFAVRLKKIVTSESTKIDGKVVRDKRLEEIKKYVEKEGLKVVSGTEVIAQGLDNPLKELEDALEEYDALGTPKQPNSAEWTVHERKLNQIFQLAQGTLNYGVDENVVDGSKPHITADDIFKPSLKKSIGVFFSIMFDPVVLGDGVVDWRSEIDKVNNDIASRADTLFRLRDPDGKIMDSIGGLPLHLNDPILFRCLSEPCWMKK